VREFQLKLELFALQLQKFCISIGSPQVICWLRGDPEPYLNTRLRGVFNLHSFSGMQLDGGFIYVG
jgi:hypothetical protein